MTACLEYGLKFAKRGIPVFVVGENKAPLVRNGFHGASTDPAKIAGWFDRWPQANLAIPTGAKSGVVVLDLDVAPDGHPAGAESLRVLEELNDRLPQTLTVKTPRGGEHLYLRHPGGTVPCSAGKLGPGLDVRGDGGYVVVPPSVGPAGRPYEYDNETKPVPIPEWLTLLLLGVAPGMRKHPTDPNMWVSILRNGFQEGERDQGMARLVGRYFAIGMSAGEVRLLALWVNQRSQPPLPDADVERIVRSIAAKHLRFETERLRRAA